MGALETSFYQLHTSSILGWSGEENECATPDDNLKHPFLYLLVKEQIMSSMCHRSTLNIALSTSSKSNFSLFKRQKKRSKCDDRSRIIA